MTCLEGLPGLRARGMDPTLGHCLGAVLEDAGFARAELQVLAVSTREVELEDWLGLFVELLLLELPAGRAADLLEQLDREPSPGVASVFPGFGRA